MEILNKIGQSCQQLELETSLPGQVEDSLWRQIQASSDDLDGLANQAWCYFAINYQARAQAQQAWQIQRTAGHEYSSRYRFGFYQLEATEQFYTAIQTSYLTQAIATSLRQSGKLPASSDLPMADLTTIFPISDVQVSPPLPVSFKMDIDDLAALFDNACGLADMSDHYRALRQQTASLLSDSTAINRQTDMYNCQLSALQDLYGKLQFNCQRRCQSLQTAALTGRHAFDSYFDNQLDSFHNPARLSAIAIES